MRRRDFLRAGTGMLAAAALPVLPERVRAAEVVNVTLRSAPLRTKNLAYNGTIPGPLLRVTHGQRVRVRYVSDVDVPTSVHWHGMVLPNAMDGVAWVTQPPVRSGGEFIYDFVPGPPGTRWYHDHAFNLASARGLFGMFIIDDPAEAPADKEFALVFHDVPNWSSLLAAVRGVSKVPEFDPMPSDGSMLMAREPMGDEVAYDAHLINGAAFPNGERLVMRVGDRVRLRLLNASPTQTRYVRLAGHELLVTHADGNSLALPPRVDVLRIGAGERYDAVFEVRRAGAFLLYGISTDPLESQQAVVVATEGMEKAPPQRDATTLEGLRVFSYALAGGAMGQTEMPPPTFDLKLGGGGLGNPRWTIDGQVWPHTPKLHVRQGESVTIRFRNASDMDHPMHLHGHVFELIEVNGSPLLRPIAKDGALVAANGGTATCRFTAAAAGGRWMLHCHNDVHMVAGMMTELVYLE